MKESIHRLYPYAISLVEMDYIKRMICLEQATARSLFEIGCATFIVRLQGCTQLFFKRKTSTNFVQIYKLGKKYSNIIL